jgi:hypothetical protein
VNKRPEFDSKFYKNGFLPTLIAGLFVDATSLWLGKGKPYSTTQIARYCYRMMCTLLKDLPNWE